MIQRSGLLVRVGRPRNQPRAESMSALQNDILRQVNEIMRDDDLNLGKMLVNAVGANGKPLSGEAYRKIQSGSPPRLDTLERIAKGLRRRLVVRFHALSGSRGIEEPSQSTREADNVSDDSIQLARMIHELSDSDRERVTGIIEGLRMRSRPSELVAGNKAPRAQPK